MHGAFYSFINSLICNSSCLNIRINVWLCFAVVICNLYWICCLVIKACPLNKKVLFWKELQEVVFVSVRERVAALGIHSHGVLSAVFLSGCLYLDIATVPFFCLWNICFWWFQTPPIWIKMGKLHSKHGKLFFNHERNHSHVSCAAAITLL